MSDVTSRHPSRVRVLALTHVFPRHVDDANAPFLLRHLQGLSRAGLDVRVLAPHDAGLPLEHDVGGVAVRRVRYGTDQQETLAYRGEMHQLARTPAGAWRTLGLLRALRSAVREELASWRPDVLDVHWLIPAGLVARSVRTRVPVQLNVHGTDVALVASGGAAAAAGRLAVGVADRVAAMSVPLADELERTLGRRADVVVPMPAAMPLVDAGPRPGRDAILAIGRLVPEKGHADLVRAVATLRSSRPGCTLTIVGDGPEKAALAGLASSLDVPLALPGAVPPAALEARYRDADVVVVPSHREGFGLVAAEALARYRPVVATAAGGLTEIVTDGPAPTGWSVPPGDAAALVAAIADALDDPAEAERRAARGASRVAERWSPQALAERAAADLRQLARGAVGG